MYSNYRILKSPVVYAESFGGTNGFVCKLPSYENTAPTVETFNTTETGSTEFTNFYRIRKNGEKMRPHRVLMSKQWTAAEEEAIIEAQWTGGFSGATVIRNHYPYFTNAEAGWFFGMDHLFSITMLAYGTGTKFNRHLHNRDKWSNWMITAYTDPSLPVLTTDITQVAPAFHVIGYTIPPDPTEYYRGLCVDMDERVWITDYDGGQGGVSSVDPSYSLFLFIQ